MLLLGFASKLYSGPGAGWVSGSAGGVLYVAFWLLLVLAVAPRLAPARVAVAVFLVTSVLELLQLWQPAWLAPIRASFLGHALVGSTFSALDFPHYALGALIGWAYALRAGDGFEIESPADPEVPSTMAEVDPRMEAWREPVRGGYPDPALFVLPGIDRLRAQLDGKTPTCPLSHLVGTRLTEVGPGKATFTMPASPWLVSPQGAIAVGTLAILADAPLGCAIQTALPPGTAYTTSELSLRAVRPAQVGSLLTAKGRLVHAGRRIALSEVLVEDAAGRLVAHGSSLCFVFPATSPPIVRPSGSRLAREPEHATPDPYLRPVVGAVVPQKVWDEMSGLEMLTASLAGELPAPATRYLLGLRLVEAARGSAAFALPATEWLCPPTGMVEGGVIAMLADAALSSAIMTVTPAATAMAPFDLKVNFLRPGIADGRELFARGTVAHAGRTIVVAHSEVVNADGKHVALATGSALLLPGRSASLVDLPID